MLQKKEYALITGATSGIGYELSKLFAKDGYNLVIVARGEEGLDRTATEIEREFGVNVIKISKDLFETENAFALYREVKQQGIEVTLLVNDAGQGVYGEFIETNIERELSIIRLNIVSLVVLTKQFLVDMVARGDGKILNVAAVASKLPGPLQAVYHGTKAFVHSFTEAIREEVKGKGIVITSLLPGATDTDFFNKASMTGSKVVQEGKLDSPETVAKDGHAALMNDEDMIISGFQNKMQIALSNLKSDSSLAEKIHKQHASVDKK
jgi:short-subunit dehydrogenase